MKTHQEKQRQCGSRMYNSANCHSKIRKVMQNRFEKVFLCGKHAFSYSVIIQNIGTNETKETIFPDRKAAICFFLKAVKRYDNREFCR